MYLTEARGYITKTGNQCVYRAPFLMLIQSKDRDLGPDNFRALVRQVALQQCGHWMMGCARVKNRTLTVSGTYGSDGLPMTVDEEIFEMGTPVPRELYDKWANGKGWNGPGAEGKEMREWARENLLKRR